MLTYLGRRLVLSLVTLFGLTLLVFVLINLSGDPIRLLLPPDAPQSEVVAYRHAMGLDAPLPIRYARFVRSVARFDFGTSIQLGQPALALVMQRLPATLSLAGLAVALAVLIGLPLGVTAATRRNSAWDSLVTAMAVTGQSTPVFWLAIMGILLFAVRLRWLPAAGIGGWQHYVLPSTTLALFLLGGIVRVTRTSVLEVLGKAYVRSARAKGVAQYLVIWRHALRNAAIPIVTVIGLQLRFVLGGSVITETVFAWPGLGRLLVQAVYARDYPVVEAGVFVVAVLLILANMLVDVSYTLLNPRVRVR